MRVKASRRWYENHVNVDRKHKLVRRYHVSDAAQHDSQAVDHLLMRGNTGSGVWADAAYRSEETEAKLRARQLKSHIHRKGKRGKPLTEQAKGSNRTKSSVRVRVEHIFGAQANDMGGTLVRTIGLVRAKAKIGMKNLAYNMYQHRAEMLEAAARHPRDRDELAERLRGGRLRVSDLLCMRLPVHAERKGRCGP